MVGLRISFTNTNTQHTFLNVGVNDIPGEATVGHQAKGLNIKKEEGSDEEDNHRRDTEFELSDEEMGTELTRAAEDEDNMSKAKGVPYLESLESRDQPMNMDQAEMIDGRSYNIH